MDIFTGKTILSVSRLTALLRGVIEENFEQVWVEGEVSNYSIPASGHIYFTLKDAGAQIRGIMFKSAAKNLKFKIADGMALIARGRLSVYDQRGEYQLICEYLEPSGLGALQLSFLQLKERLDNEGLFDQSRKRPLPPFPRRLGVITSPTGAAIHDILTVLRRRFASLEVLLYPVRVQGDEAAGEIASAIVEMNRLHQVDVLIVGRGGGSLEDLWPFNDERVARAIHASSIPIISAIGHDTDWTISDFVSDLRAPTPSAAAELVTATTEELGARLSALTHRLSLGIQTLLCTNRSKYRLLHRALHDPGTMIGHLSQRLDDVEQRLSLAMKNHLRHHRDQHNSLDKTLLFNSPIRTITSVRYVLNELTARSATSIRSLLEHQSALCREHTARLDVLSPLHTLSRGYGIVSRVSDQAVITDVASLAPGEQVQIRVHRGSARCRVESTDPAIDPATS